MYFNINQNFTKWPITPWWKQIMRTGFQYPSTDPYLCNDFNIIQISPQTPEIQPFPKDHFYGNFSENSNVHEWYLHKMFDYAMMNRVNCNWLSMIKTYRIIPFWWYEYHSNRFTNTRYTMIWKWQYLATSVKMNNHMNGTLTKWLIKIGFQYSKSTALYLSCDMNIIQIGSQRLEIQLFKNDNILQL